MARRRRYGNIEGQIALEDLFGPSAEGAQKDESLRDDGPAALGTVAAATVRGDPGSGQLLLGAGRGSGPAARRPDAGPGGRRPARGGLPGQAGPAERSAQPGGGDPAAGAGAAATRVRSRGGPGGAGGAAFSRPSLAR